MRKNRIRKLSDYVLAKKEGKDNQRKFRRFEYSGRGVKNLTTSLNNAGDYIKSKNVVQLLSNRQLLKLTEKVVKSVPTKFDQAMDAIYLQTRIGGGNHRLFDGRHTLSGAWKSAFSIQGCTNSEKAIGFLKSFIKDLSTPKGMPFVTIQPKTYDSISNTLTKIPGVDRRYVYDLLSYNVLKVASVSIGLAAILYHLNQQNYDQLGEILGSIGIVAVASANLLLGIIAIAFTAYVIKTGTLKTNSVIKGASITTLGFALFSMMSAPVLIKLTVVMTTLAIADKYGTEDNINKMTALKDQLKGILKNNIKKIHFLSIPTRFSRQCLS